MVVCSRSREGAWIEIVIVMRVDFFSLCRSREGAWIEMHASQQHVLQESSLP